MMGVCVCATIRAFADICLLLQDSLFCLDLSIKANNRSSRHMKTNSTSNQHTLWKIITAMESHHYFQVNGISPEFSNANEDIKTCYRSLSWKEASQRAAGRRKSFKAGLTGKAGTEAHHTPGIPGSFDIFHTYIIHPYSSLGVP